MKAGMLISGVSMDFSTLGRGRNHQQAISWVAILVVAPSVPSDYTEIGLSMAG